MSPLLWGLLPAAAIGGGLLIYMLMEVRTQYLLGQQREEMAAARATLAAHQEALADTLRNAEEAAKRKAMDEFLSEIRVEERMYTREHKMLFLTRKSLVRQERIFFRNIPLSTWVEQEMQVEEGADLEKLAQTMAIFSGEFLAGQNEANLRKPALQDNPIRRLLR